MDGERSMTKSELIELIAAKQSHLPAKDVELAVKQILEIMSDALAQGQRIEIRGFGSFSLHFRPPRQGRNPKTGETVALAGKYVPHFKPGKDLRERVNDPLEDNDAGGSDVTPIGAPGLGGLLRPGRWWWWWSRPWFDHQNLRDDRVEAFSSLLWEGVHEYRYVARATTPGAFVVPPPKAEKMYAPETFGRGATDRVVVE